MSFSTIFQCANDVAFQHRITACCAQEGQDDPVAAMAGMVWPISSHSDIEAAYASAVLSENPNPGGDESVVTDQMILGAVQAALASP
jgi:hypothetical protein